MKTHRMFLVAALALVACSQGGEPGATVTLRTEGQRPVVVTAEIADDAAERTQGLMFRTDLPEGQGMLFVFDTVNVLSFWMRNTLIPLDILYFDDAGNFVSGTTMVPCEADPCTVYPSGQPARYALEVPAGFLEEHQVGVGWKMSVEY
jgi:uncharacterized protein